MNDIAAMVGPGYPDMARLRAVPGIQKYPGSGVMMFQLRRFLNDAECAHLMQLIDASRRPSTVADGNGDDLFRTSETCDLNDADPVVDAVNRRLSQISGIDPAHGEPVQGQRYAVGQEFKAHTDYFEPHLSDYPVFCSRSGNRTWTFMIYLNTTPAGGATRFPQIGKMVQPEAGKLLCWNNRTDDGGLNYNTLHHAMKVRSGTKYVITKWYRERIWAG